ncbi:hypothetical protein PHYSODRAFT_257631 [Phytophthora sojae]|uniref:Retrotransposon gag domain-containing protein n=1 Tax=Phytophthora sojae (strain P6497) TaxID=1094619 RepID=G4YEU4_PHYSP|nr:hypothetical protein PHYSODRAFT_257631 [Phytophthora sojae]EGZ27308.1 hypothetical protein PHYSODRAFT_257631 [Phytophthora sojae]|eukprot:XP_009514583.1 hypothetical protein PHYSODRAFT_257631 [Phytophthora sojae]
MAKGSKSAVPATPVKSVRGSAEGSSTIASDLTSRLSTISERSVSFEESVDEDSDAKDDMMMDYDDLEEKTPVTTQEFGDEEDAMLSGGRSGGSRSLSRNLVAEFDEVAKPDHADDDFEDGTETSASRALVQVTKGPQESRGSRPAMNSSTPAANKVLGRMLEQMVAEDTVSLLRVMGCEPRNRPSEVSIKSWTPGLAGKELHKWKRKLRLSFGESDLTLGRPPSARPAREQADPSKIPLPQTPKKSAERSNQSQATDGVFSAKTEGSPYFQDSHMASRADRIARESEGSRRERSTQRSSTRRSSRRFTPRDDSSSDEDNNDNIDYEDGFDSPSDELARQVREVSEMERLSSTPRLEIATHRPLAQIKNFSGARNRSENSMQWLRAFVYKMKGTHTPPNEWCMAFELSLRDGALHWYRQLPKRTNRQWKRLSDAFIKYYCSQFSQSAKARYYSAKRESSEHLCDYLNRLNGYARNAGIQFKSGGRDAKDHVQRFLETCGDRSLERRLCHVRVKDIHELEDMINDILKSEERGRDQPRRRDDRRHEASRDSYRRDRDRGYERRREDSRHVPRISRAEASLSDLVAELQVRGTKGGRAERSSPRRTPYSDSESDASYYHYSESDPSDGGYSDVSSSGEGGAHVAAANERERRQAAEGTYARPDQRQRKG